MRAALLVLGLGLVACGADDDDPHVHDSPCADESRGSTLMVGDTFTGEDGLAVEVVALDPAPPEVGDNTWTLAVSGADGCTLEVEPWMPDHSHGSSVGSSTFEAGDLTISDLEISMGGYWEITLTATCDEAEKTAVVGLCVDA